MIVRARLIGIFLPLISTTSALWPIPRVLSAGSSPLTLSDAFSIEIAFELAAPQDFKDAVTRTKDYIDNDKLGRLVPGRGPGNISLNDAPCLQKLLVYLSSNETELGGSGLSFGFPTLRYVEPISQVTRLPVEERDESYVLDVPSDGSDAMLVANTTLGLLRGLTTFSQIWYYHEGQAYTVEAPFRIVDEPYYKWRGLLLDTSRNFYPVEVLKRTLDAMSWTKINMFHWHVVDSQSFPLVLPGFEYLAENGAYSPSQLYSTGEVEDIIAYAASRGIDVMLEIDTPGHTAAIHHSHPEYVACFEAKPWTYYANEPPAGQLRLAEPAVLNFTQALFNAASNLTPGKYFSTGGDEINLRCYQDDATTQSTLASSGRTIREALATFTQDTHGTLVDKGKTPVVWEEMVLEHGSLGLNPQTIALVWKSSANAKKVANAGYKLIHAPSDYFYLDCGQGEWIGNPSMLNSWCDPFKSWRKAYTFDPKAGLSGSQVELVLGGQQLLWSEQSDPSNIDPVLWPRAAASAEVFWTGPIHPNGNPLNPDEALPRLHDLRYRMVQRGVRAIPIQPEYCALRPHLCDER